MNIIQNFFESLLFEIIFFFLFSSGLFALYLRKAKNSVNLKSIGIHHIHKKGQNIKNTINAINSSRQIKIIAFMPYSFIFDYKELLVKKIKDGCNIKFLVCSPNSLLLKELSQMERHVDNDISSQYDLLINLLQGIKADAGNEATGSIEVRMYNTEIRNPAIICIDEKNNKSAFLTLSVPPYRSIDSIMIEYRDSNCDFVMNYFDIIWERHPNDLSLKLP